MALSIKSMSFSTLLRDACNELHKDEMLSVYGADSARFFTLGSVIGMSLLNSIFVDAMVSDNNDDVKETLAKMQNDIKEIKELLIKDK